MDRTQFIIATVAVVQARWPHLTQKQAALIAERVAQREDAALSPIWSWEKPELAAEYTQVGLTQVVAAVPELLRLAPTVGQYVALQAAEVEAKLGRPATATEKLVFARNAAALTPDDLLERIPADTKLPELSAVAPRPTLKAVADDIDSLDAEVLRRFGKKPHELMAGDRLRYHNAIKDEHRRDASAETNAHAALADAGGDFSKLPPAERMSRYRAAEKAKASNRT